VSDHNPYAPLEASLNRPSRSPARKGAGCCLIPALGFVIGGVYGWWDYGRAIDEAIRQGEVADYLPVGVPVFAVLGAMLGALLTPVVFAARLRLTKRSQLPQ
jgi:hypothetical protein